jgi:BirA family biotin operon repressor/biotin-[acetyl-CoA-carboxylase] ligase
MGSTKIGAEIIQLEEVDSTNEYAKKLIPEVQEGAVIVAKRQTSGKGRKGRFWASPEGGIWASVILRPPRIDPRLVFVGALAVADTLRDFGIGSWIKWPNDVWVGNRKISGILTEVKGDFAIMGIGINVNNEIPKELKETATSLRDLLGKAVDLEEVLKRLLRNLNCWYEVFLENPDLIVEEIKKRTVLIGKLVKVITEEGTVEGKVLDILSDGTLLLDGSRGPTKILYGDVSLRF